MSRGTLGRVREAGTGWWWCCVQGTGTLLSTLQWIRQTPPQRTVWTKMSVVPKLRNSNTKTHAKDTNTRRVRHHPPAAGQWEGQ